jgi:hypothetical protein
MGINPDDLASLLKRPVEEKLQELRLLTGQTSLRG